MPEGRYDSAMLLQRIEQQFIESADLKYQCAQSMAPRVEMAVMAVMAVMPKQPKAANVLRSACMPAPPPLSEPAMESTRVYSWVAEGFILLSFIESAIEQCD